MQTARNSQYNDGMWKFEDLKLPLCSFSAPKNEEIMANIDSSLVFIVLLISMELSLCLATTSYYTFGKDCSVSIEHVNENKIAYLEYNGEDELDSWCDQMSFIGRDSEYLNEYKVCVTPEVYKDPRCGIEMYYKNDYSGVKLETFDCSNKPNGRYCAKQDENFYIEMRAPKSKYHRRDVKIKLKVEGIMVYDYYERVGIIVGSVIGGLVLLCCCCTCGIYMCRKSKGSSGHVITSGSAAVPLTNTTATTETRPTQPYYYPQPTNSPQPTNFSTPGVRSAQPQQISTDGYSPNQYHTNYTTQYSPPMVNSAVEASAPPLSGISEPPPSYDVATKMQ